MTPTATHASHRSRLHRPAAALTCLMLMLSACSQSPAPPASAPSPADRAQKLAAASGAPLTAGSPWLLMRDSSAGDAVWPSGTSFVLLHTVDGWRHVTNITPSAVPTGGGLAIATSSRELVVAVLPFDRLVVSPVLTRTSTGGIWSADELPGGLRPGRGAVALGPGGVTAILATGGGTVVQKGPHGWVILSSASRLMPGGPLRLDSLSWAEDGRRGWLTGHGPAGSPVAFTTNDSGQAWEPIPIPGLASDAVAALTPCRAGGRTWTLPVVRARGTISVASSADDGATWSTGVAVRVPLGVPAWGCHGAQVWLLGGSANGDHVYSSANFGATWSDQGLAPVGISDLIPTGGHEGFAASATKKGAVLWAVRRDGGSFSPLALPSWVAAVGQQTTPQD